MRVLLGLFGELFKLSLLGLLSLVLLLLGAPFLRLDEKPEKTEAIVVLLGGQGPERVLRASELYAQGLAPKIIFGSGFRNEKIFAKIPESVIWPKPSETYKAALISLGVPENAISIVDTGQKHDTAGELGAIAKKIAEDGLNSVALVSSATHTRRVSLIWDRVAPKIPARTYSAIAPGYDKFYLSGFWLKTIFYEYGALTKEGLVRLKNLF